MLKKWIRNLAAALLCLGLVNTAMADRLQEILTAGVIRIGVPLDVPPFGSQNVNREAEGFDVDMANMVAKAMGVKLELTQITGANRLPFLLTDKVDVVISVMGLTPERAKQIMFSSPYANTSLAVYGPKNIVVKSAMDLGKYKVAAAKGTTQEMALSAANPKANIMRTDDDGREILLYYIKAGESCIMSFLGGMHNDTSKVKAIAEEETEILFIPIDKVTVLIKEFPEWLDYIFRLYHKRFEELLEVVNAVAFKKMDERLLSFIQKKCALNQTNTLHLTHEQIATELGTARVVVSRLLKQMEDEGLVLLGRNKISLV